MLKLLVLLLLTDQGTFTAGIETAEGLKSKTFANSSQGAEEFFAFAQPIMTTGDGRYSTCLVPVGKGDWGAIWEAFEAERLVYAVLPQSAIEMHGVGTKPNIASAANACVQSLKIYGQKNF